MGERGAQVIVALLLLLALLCPPRPPVEPTERAFATRYTLGLMRRVATKRGIEMTGCGMAIDQQRLGSFVLVHGVKTGIRRLCVVVDYSGPRDRARHIRNRLIELDSLSQEKVCGAKVAMSRWKECPVLIKRFP